MITSGTIQLPEGFEFQKTKRDDMVPPYITSGGILVNSVSSVTKDGNTIVLTTNGVVVTKSELELQLHEVEDEKDKIFFRQVWHREVKGREQNVYTRDQIKISSARIDASCINGATI